MRKTRHNDFETFASQPAAWAAVVSAVKVRVRRAYAG